MVVLVGRWLLRVDPSCGISWFVEKRQDWKMVVLAGRCVIRLGPSRGLSLPGATWIGRWSVDHGVDLELTEGYRCGFILVRREAAGMVVWLWSYL
jgi:hypothetical protein